MDLQKIRHADLPRSFTLYWDPGKILFAHFNQSECATCVCDLGQARGWISTQNITYY